MKSDYPFISVLLALPLPHRFRVLSLAKLLLFALFLITARQVTAAPDTLAQSNKNAASPPHAGASTPANSVSTSEIRGLENKVLVANLDGKEYVAFPIAKITDLPPTERVNSAALLPAFMSFLTEALWPAAASFIIWLLLRSPKVQIFLARASSRITQLNVAGLEIKLSEGAAATLEDLQALIRQIPETNKEWVSNSKISPQFQLVVSDIKNYLTTSSCDSGRELEQHDFASFRFTLHVADVLLAHSLRQLVNYSGSHRGGAGRIYSMRMGIIGRAWRMGKSEFEPNRTFSEAQLIEMWGMTAAEAHDTSGGKKVHLAVLIKSDQGLPLGVLYADTEKSELFSSTRKGTLSDQEVFDRFEKKVIEFSRNRGLKKSLEELEAARIKIPQIDLYEPGHS